MYIYIYAFWKFRLLLATQLPISIINWKIDIANWATQFAISTYYNKDVLFLHDDSNKWNLSFFCNASLLQEGQQLQQHTLQHAATHCKTLYLTRNTHCNTLQHTVTHCNALQNTTTHCNTHCNTLQQRQQHKIILLSQASQTHCRVKAFTESTLIIISKTPELKKLGTWKLVADALKKTPLGPVRDGFVLPVLP